MNLNFTRLLTLGQKNPWSYFLAVILDFQDGCHSIITLTYTRIFVIIKDMGLDTMYVIECNLWHIQLGASRTEDVDIK